MATMQERPQCSPSEGLSEQIFEELPKYAALMQFWLSVIKKSLKKKGIGEK
jgi:hypothetical protein